MKKFLIAGSTLLLLAACDDGGTSSSSASVTPTAAQQACLTDVAATTGNTQVKVLGSEFSEAGTSVRVGVGPDMAPWSCIAYSDGSTAGITSLTDEGAA